MIGSGSQISRKPTREEIIRVIEKSSTPKLIEIKRQETIKSKVTIGDEGEVDDLGSFSSKGMEN
jgi:hypothetical protein